MEEYVLWVEREYPVYFIVRAVDYRIQLYRRLSDGSSTVVYRKQTGATLDPHTLFRQRWYYPLFDNNDGGEGRLALSVAQNVGGEWRKCGYEVDITVHGPSSPRLAPFILKNRR